MKVSNLCTALFVKNIEISKSFYTKVMGFTIEHDFGINISFKEGFAIWEIQDSHIIPKKVGGKNILNRNSKRFELYFETETIEDVEHTLKEHQVRFLHQIHIEPWEQKTLRFFDPDEHLIEIGETLQHLVTRLKNSGLTVEKVASKTGISIPEIEKLLKK